MTKRQTTGREIKDWIKLRKLQLSQAESTFLLEYVAESPESKEEIPKAQEQLLSVSKDNAKRVFELESCIVKLQSLQNTLNSMVIVEVGETKHSLADAVKMLGVVNRLKVLWEGAKPSSNPYGRNRFDGERPKVLISQKAIDEQVMYYTQYSNALQQAIGRGNSTPVSLEVPDGLEPSKFVPA